MPTELHPDERSFVVDADAFVAEAERMTNSRDVDAILGVFAPAARWTTVLDGTEIVATGHAQIRRTWAQLCRVMDRRSLVVEKRVLAKEGGTLVTEWSGTSSGGRRPGGLEIWQFGSDGVVHQQLLTGSMDPRPMSSWSAKLRMARSQPTLAVHWAAALASGRVR